ncbi:hypothetical protein BDZ91DRAFT_722437 [Kalaharituber pfeilii]|nr:hypothetical protein BDZ91DRAFT_722437 [Kalaharituber pfeilii]
MPYLSYHPPPTVPAALHASFSVGAAMLKSMREPPLVSSSPTFAHPIPDTHLPSLLIPAYS